MNLKTIALVSLASLFIVGGCSKEEAKPPSDKPSENKETEAKEELKYVFPLTGVATNDAIDQRPIAVMINNHPKARPQSGLEQADVVYELLAEGDVTRFLAIYQSDQPDKIGPVRSARDYYIKLAKGLDSIYVCHGYSPEAKAMLNEGYVDSLNGLFYDGTLFERDKSRKAPHNSYTTFEDIEKGAKENDFDLKTETEQFDFLSKDELKSLEGETASKVTVKYGSRKFDATYDYNESEGKYYRANGDDQTIDEETDNAIVLDNIIIMEAPHAVVDNEGRRNIDLSNGGEAYLLQKGKWNKIQWKNVDNLITFIKDGEKVRLVPGKTWVNVVPDKPGLQSTVNFE